MKSETLYRALGEIDGALLREADAPRRRMPRAAKIAAAAACFLCIGGAALALAAGGGKSAENAGGMSGVQDAAYAPSFSEEMRDEAAAHSAVLFVFYDGGTRTVRTREYPDGVPAASEVLNEYLAEASCAPRVTAVRRENGAAYAELDGELTPDAARGLAETLLALTGEARAVLVSPAGETEFPAER